MIPRIHRYNTAFTVWGFAELKTKTFLGPTKFGLVWGFPVFVFGLGPFVWACVCVRDPWDDVQYVPGVC